MPKYKDDDIYIKKSDLDGIRKRPTMYIGNIGPLGVLHLIKEMIDNNRDECFKSESPGNFFSITATAKEITTSDNGRGISVYPPKNAPPGKEDWSLLRIVHETNQAGSNMTRSGGNTSGENGTGTAAYTALAGYLKLVSLRPSEKKKLTLVYEEGKLKEEILEDYTGKESGMTTTFRPGVKLGAEGRVIPLDLLGEYLKSFAYSLPKNINCEYTINGNTTQVQHKEPYQYFDEYISDDFRMCEALPIECKGKLKEEVGDQTQDKEFTVNAAIMYSNADYKGKDIRQSWMNSIHTSLNGKHIDGVVKGYTQFIIDRIIRKSPKFKDEDMRLLSKDVESNLQVVVRATCNMTNMFSGQSKANVFPIVLKNAIAKAIQEALSRIDKDRIDQLVDIVISNNRVRKAGEEMRDINKGTKINSKWEKPDSYVACASTTPIHQREIYLVEGLSAQGGLRAAKENFQAILAFRGKNKNIWELTAVEAMKSETWQNLVMLLGCGLGPTFDLKKLQFDKIIICTDADIDGYHIRTGFLAFFYKFMPELIEAGKVYIAEPPLYKLGRGKDSIYVASQTEYIEKCIQSVSDIKIFFEETVNN